MPTCVWDRPQATWAPAGCPTHVRSLRPLWLVSRLCTGQVPPAQPLRMKALLGEADQRGPRRGARCPSLRRPVRSGALVSFSTLAPKSRAASVQREEIMIPGTLERKTVFLDTPSPFFPGAARVSSGARRVAFWGLHVGLSFGAPGEESMLSFK